MAGHEQAAKARWLSLREADLDRHRVAVEWAQLVAAAFLVVAFVWCALQFETLNRTLAEADRERAVLLDLSCEGISLAGGEGHPMCEGLDP